MRAHATAVIASIPLCRVTVAVGRVLRRKASGEGKLYRGASSRGKGSTAAHHYTRQLHAAEKKRGLGAPKYGPPRYLNPPL